MLLADGATVPPQVAHRNVSFLHHKCNTCVSRVVVVVVGRIRSRTGLIGERGRTRVRRASRSLIIPLFQAALSPG